MQKKILFVITKATWGGAQKYVFDLATNLSKAYFETQVAFGDRGRLSTMLEERGIPTHHLPALSRDIASFSDVASFFQIVRLLKTERPDVLHLNSSKAAALGALGARIVGILRIITTIHGWPFKERRFFLVKAFIYLASWMTCLSSHAVIVVSKRDEEIGRRMPFVRSKIHYIPLGISPVSFLSRDEAWARIQEMRTVLNPNVSRIVTIAELTPNKGLRHGIDAIVELKKRNIPCTYFIIGTGELRERLEEYAIEREVENRVVFLGFIENASQYLKAFDFFLLPSIKEGMPYVLLEAAAANVPIIATDVIDEASADIRVPPGNGRLLAEAVEHMVRSPRRKEHRSPQTLADAMFQTRPLYGR